MRTLILAAAFLGLTVAAHADDTNKKPAGTAKGAAVGALAGHEVGSGHRGEFVRCRYGSGGRTRFRGGWSGYRWFTFCTRWPNRLLFRLPLDWDC